MQKFYILDVLCTFENAGPFSDRTPPFFNDFLRKKCTLPPHDGWMAGGWGGWVGWLAGWLAGWGKGNWFRHWTTPRYSTGHHRTQGSAQYSPVQYTTFHNTTLRHTSLHYTTLHYIPRAEKDVQQVPSTTSSRYLKSRNVI